MAAEKIRVKVEVRTVGLRCRGRHALSAARVPENFVERTEMARWDRSKNKYRELREGWQGGGRSGR